MKSISGIIGLILLAALPAYGQTHAGGMQREGAANGEIGPLRTFRDWVVGCDNLRNCTALGLAGEDGQEPVYLKISRNAGPEADAEVAIIIYAQEDGDGAAEIGAEPLLGRYRADGQNGYRTSVLDAAAAKAAIETLLPETGVPVALIEGGKILQRGRISLSGMSAALRFMDAEQGRAGGESALVAKGPAAASAVPAVRAMPKVRARPLAEIDPPPPRPRGIAAGEEGCADIDDLAVRLSPDLTLRGVCTFTGAYNIGYRLYMSEGETARPLHLPVSGTEAQLPDMTGVLVNAGIEDARVLSAFNKGRGLGDCGEDSSFVWDGEAFRLAEYRMLDTCRGVAPDDWPVLYRAEIEDEG